MSYFHIISCLIYNVIYHHIIFAKWCLGVYFVKTGLYPVKYYLENTITNQCVISYPEYETSNLYNLIINITESILPDF